LLRLHQYGRRLRGIMAVVKGIYLFEAFDQAAGWSEVVYFQADTLPAALVAFQAMAQVRVQILASAFTMTHIRISNPVVPPGPGFIRGQRTATLYEVNYPGGYGGAAGSPDVVWTAAMVRMSDATQTIFRNVMFRGVDDGFWAGGNDKLARAAVTNWLAGYLAILKANAAVILHTQRGLNVKQPALIANAQYQKMTRRATGRPFVLLRGRK
jgi:hypothetical protein